MKRLSTSLLLVGMLLALPAMADEDCTVPMIEWQAREAVIRFAAEQGWELRRIRIDDGCYEVIGRDSEGRDIEVKLDPGSLAIVEFEIEDHARRENAEHEEND
jgi:hypothetical protein